MVWVVHRAWLDDPTLDEVNFSHRRVPSAGQEPRILPKLLEALGGRNRHVRRLRLACAGIRGSQVAEQLAAALAKNEGLELLDIEANLFQPCDLKTVVNVLSRNTSLLELHLAHQACEQPDSNTLASFFEVLSGNRYLRKLGVDLDDIHWRDRITRHLVRNVEAARKRRQKRRESTETQASSSSDGGYLVENLQ